jgi:multidrug efflux pump subunit AcrA (membrane-fusion protein)
VSITSSALSKSLMEVHFKAGQQVEEGARLMSMESAGEKSDATTETGQTG